MQSVYTWGAIITFVFTFFFVRKFFPKKYTFLHCVLCALGWPALCMWAIIKRL
jgi:hypothetical protein